MEPVQVASSSQALLEGSMKNVSKQVLPLSFVASSTELMRP
jgi:hypothetical protein